MQGDEACSWLQIGHALDPFFEKATLSSPAREIAQILRAARRMAAGGGDRERKRAFE